MLNEFCWRITAQFIPNDLTVCSYLWPLCMTTTFYVTQAAKERERERKKYKKKRKRERKREQFSLMLIRFFGGGWESKKLWIHLRVRFLKPWWSAWQEEEDTPSEADWGPSDVQHDGVLSAEFSRSIWNWTRQKDRWPVTQQLENQGVGSWMKND